MSNYRIIYSQAVSVGVPFKLKKMDDAYRILAMLMFLKQFINKVNSHDFAQIRNTSDVVNH